MDREQVLFRLFGRFCAQGTILYGEGSPGEEAYLVRSGAVRRTGPRGAAPAGPGAFLGEEGLLGRATRTAGAEAVADTRLLVVGARTLDSFARNGPEACAEVLAALVEEGRAARQALGAWSLALALRRVEPQLREAASGAVPLDELRERGGGDALRLLEELERSGAVAVAEGSVRVRDAAALDRAAAAITAAGEGER